MNGVPLFFFMLSSHYLHNKSFTCSEIFSNFEFEFEFEFWQVERFWPWSLQPRLLLVPYWSRREYSGVISMLFCSSYFLPNWGHRLVVSYLPIISRTTQHIPDWKSELIHATPTHHYCAIIFQCFTFEFCLLIDWQVSKFSDHFPEAISDIGRRTLPHWTLVSICVGVLSHVWIQEYCK